MNTRTGLLVLALVLCVIAGCRKKTVVQNGVWKYEGSHGVLSCEDAPVPKELAANGVSLVTPLGTFVPSSSGTWTFVAGQIPLPDPSKTWVQMTIEEPVSCTDSMRNAGFYRVDELPVNPGTWRDTQLAGTPPSWVYAFWRSGNKESGYWIAPQELGSIDWSKQ